MTPFCAARMQMEDDCRLSSVDEIAAAVHQMVAEVHAGGEDPRYAAS